MLDDPGDQALKQLERHANILHRFLGIFLACVAGLTFVMGIVIMLSIGGGKSNLANRLIVAVGALSILGAIDTQATRLANRRRPILASDPPSYRRFLLSSAAAFLSAAVILLGVAVLLP